MTNWDKRFLDLAQHVSAFSKDPSTQVGAAIIDPDRRIISLGFNGFPARVSDDVARYEDREIKYRLIVHAELNAILFAQRNLKDCTLYTWPFMPCARCAGPIIQSGITRVVAPVTPQPLWERWQEEHSLAEMMFREAGVKLYIVYGAY